MCIFYSTETGQAEVSILLQPFRITFASVLFFLSISILPDKSKTCSLSKQVTRSRYVIPAPSSQDVRAALIVSCQQRRERNISLGFFF